MSTKNLARTALEGGRAWGNTDDRRYTHRGERRATRDALSAVRSVDDADEVLIAPRVVMYRHFHDKLAAAERWLRAQVGRPWDKVRGELFTRFDTRTTAGRHIVFDHMLGWVRVGALDERWNHTLLFVGRGGILRPVVRTKRARRAWNWTRPSWTTWLASRRVAVRGGAFFWLEPTERGGYRQGRRLSIEESAYWTALPAWFRGEQGRVM